MTNAQLNKDLCECVCCVGSRVAAYSCSYSVKEINEDENKLSRTELNLIKPVLLFLPASVWGNKLTMRQQEQRRTKDDVTSE